MLIHGQQFSQETLEKINAEVRMEPSISRCSLSRRVCQWLNWRGDNGRLREMSCRKALLRLDREGLIVLPEVSGQWSFQRRRDRSVDLPPLGEVECDLSALGVVEVSPVTSRYSKSSRVWTALMEEYHYLGAGPLCGAQIRYLVRSSEFGWLGALSFSASAWRVKAREEYIGWSEGARRRNLQKVVCNSRFLIVPTVKVKNLASHVLSQCIKRLGGDWEERYGYAPVLLETYVDSERFRGTCYRGANWVYVGQTSGRGRQDGGKQASGTPKAIYVYPLCQGWGKLLCEGGQEGEQEPSPKREPEDWAEEEFGLARLGDERLRKRLCEMGRDFYSHPGANIPEACQSRAKTKAAYRFLDHEGTDMDTVLRSHYEATTERIRSHEVVLVVQDTTTLNYTAHPLTDDLGPINTTQDNGIGLLLHDTMAFSEEGTPLGLLDVQCWARDWEDVGKRARRKQLPIKEKESFKWLKSYWAVSEVQKRCGDTKLILLGDRESDIYELFVEAKKDPQGAELLVRSERTRQRKVEGNESLWEKMAGEPAVGIQEVQVPRKGSRPARLAKLEVRFSSMSLKPPKRDEDLSSVKVWAVYSREVDCPEGAPALEWMLLTTVGVESFEEATRILAWYTKRWGIEVYHRTLKSGCKIEDRQLGKAKRIESCLAIDMVVAWRIYHLTLLGRETPEVPCTVYFEEAEWKALVAYVTQDPTPPEAPPTLREAVRMVGKIGGFLGRKSDGEPGTTTMWRGLQRLDDIAVMWKVFNQSMNDQPPPVSKKPGYG